MLTIWATTLVVGFAILWQYTLTPGVVRAASSHHIADFELPKVSSHAMLVMTVHPLCPCSQASVRELAEIAAEFPDTVSIDILFVQLAPSTEAIESTTLWRASELIPNARLLKDVKGIGSRKLGAVTSGMTYLFDAQGALRFSGGITDSRGHAGPNAGRAAIEAILRSETANVQNAPVYGCQLQDDPS